jgi:hypothetical protein
MATEVKAPLTKDDVTGYECRFAVHCPPPNGERGDFHLVKEIMHLKDGTTVPKVRMIKDFKRPFWITKKGFQNHKDKKEWEDIDRCIRYESTQVDLARNISKALGDYGRPDLRRLCRSPYVYGADILSTAIIKKLYMDQWPELITPYSLATFDIETDVVRGTDDIIMATVSYKNRVYTAVLQDHVEGQTDVMARLHEKMNQYLDEYVEKRKIEWEVEIVKREIDVVIKCFEKAHEWKPDFLAIWNMDFDLPKCIKAIEKAGVNPASIFSDPAVPKEFQFFDYKRGQTQKVTASGKSSPKKWTDQWHTVFCPSSFYVVDAACAYKQIRTGRQEEPSYALDSILMKHLGIRKLKFKEADGMTGRDWHQFMQERYPLEYVVYNTFDCISLEELDEKTLDLSLSMPMFSGCSDFSKFNSQPRRLVDNLHFFVQQHGKVMGTTSDQMQTDLDAFTIDLKGWIVTLPAHLVIDNGLQIIMENPMLRTNIRGHVGDLDVSASYPNGGSVFNISKETTRRELCAIKGVPEIVQRMQGVNLSAGHVNAVEIATELFGLPRLEALLESYERHQIRI